MHKVESWLNENIDYLYDQAKKGNLTNYQASDIRPTGMDRRMSQKVLFDKSTTRGKGKFKGKSSKFVDNKSITTDQYADDLAKQRFKWKLLTEIENKQRLKT